MQRYITQRGKSSKFFIIHKRHQFSDSRSSVNLSRLIKRNQQQTGCIIMTFDCRDKELKHNLNEKTDCLQRNTHQPTSVISEATMEAR